MHCLEVLYVLHLCSASDIGVEVSKNTVNHPYMAVVIEDSTVKIFTISEGSP